MKHVYFITGAGLTKIGLTGDTTQRLADLQSGSPVELTLQGSFPATWRTEQFLHETYAEHRRHGEWFAFEATPELVHEIQAFIERIARERDGEEETRRHLARTRSERVLSRSVTPNPEQPPATGRICRVPGCNRSHRAKGFCTPHYHANRRGRLHP